MFSKKSRRTQSSFKMFLSDTTSNNKKTTPNNLNMNFTKNVTNFARNVNNNIINSFNANNLSIRNTGGMSWGPPTWCFLHTLVEKIKVEHFSIVRLDILKNIYSICSNLPCPECSMHAKNYLNNINFNALKSKEDIKNMLYDFHNDVNGRKGKSLFNRNDLENEYKNNVLTTTFYNFLVKFKDKNASNRFIHEDLYRSRLSSTLVDWFKKNQQYFNE